MARDFMNALLIPSFSKFRKLAMRLRVFNFLLALLQREETCSSKLSFESIMIASKVSFACSVIEAYI